ncbi:MAG TPA: bifunctional phosphopantothenoylcysteine decarboxylase/phosphopantothenate--cysteine ligase CoaBC [Bacteroidetes bacterium]|nr:bifunctional phosphopantothenoylcysteine decarboxylase/phosphopantothenate--cysteine ligase CoaBC [Bacteroidota bacterium]
MKGRKIILAITGSIAAYKAAFLTRLFIKAGAEVQVLMTPSATAFVAPLTLSTLSKRPVHTQVVSGDSWNSHVDLGLWADAMVVAPATANTLARLANGICDNIVAATYLSARCPVFLAPAMDLDMWKHPSTKRNVDLLKSYGNQVIPVGHGELASGLTGDGRMAEPEDIVHFLQKHFSGTQHFAGQKVLVTAGPTYEPLDPVRFIGNRSSGKMGLAIAQSFAKKGAQVKLVLGPSKLKTELKNIETIRVATAKEMFNAAAMLFPKMDIAVFAAAVADYRPKNIAEQKIKKKGGDMSIELERTTDIAFTLGKEKKKGQITVGFALETNDGETNAHKKLEKKNFDMIVLNSLRDAGAGFGFDTNKITILKKGNIRKDFKLKSKTEVAEDIVAEVLSLKNKKEI